MTPDSQLMNEIQQGNRRSFAVLVDRYKDRIVRYLAHIVGDQSQAEDLAQTFLKLYLHARHYQEKDRLSGYLYRIASNLARAAHRRKKRRRLLRLMFQTENGNSPDNIESRLQQDEDRNQVNQAIQALPLRYRIPIILHELEGQSLAEIAQTSGVRMGTIKSRLFRGRLLLKRELAAYVEVIHE